MSIHSMIFVRVTDSTVQIMTSHDDIMTWISNSIEAHKTRNSLKIDSSNKNWLTICGYSGRESAILYASWLVRFLSSNGWREVTYNEYIDGHWYRKEAE
ncbi:MAG: hypothetical protein UT96_C0007G0015 [Candidatus Woesebacteria bacterium GW2011_GWC2_40_30]|nr:MAG: hypothetical protein UT88_C0011G0009 [Candidatus Woesebacteria bacterium GW2011_GWD2_40_19]KKR58348.1 MAG: hypothetical protein UT96_C0007G0015 [Candidatus Woesebacteria bacterium GW2011_GWC2_40_30]HCC08910.1 hypothetical protein [Candidatus Woesebacteria bacterium]